MFVRRFKWIISIEFHIFILVCKNNIINSNKHYYNSGEIADIIEISGIINHAKLINKIQIAYFAALNTFKDNQSLIMRLYNCKNTIVDGKKLMIPDQILYKSDNVLLKNGYNSLIFSEMGLTIPAGLKYISVSFELLSLSNICKVSVLRNKNHKASEEKKYIWENDNWKSIDLAAHNSGVSCFIIGEILNPELESIDGKYRTGDSLNINIINESTNIKDWFGIYNDGIIPGSESPSVWQYTNGAKDFNSAELSDSRQIKLDLKAGKYNLYYFKNDTFEFWDKKEFQVFENPYIYIEQKPLIETSPIKISYQSNYVLSADKIEIYNLDSQTNEIINKIDWAYLNGDKQKPNINNNNGLVEFDALEEGKYKAIFIDGNNRSLYEVL